MAILRLSGERLLTWSTEKRIISGSGCHPGFKRSVRFLKLRSRVYSFEQEVLHRAAAVYSNFGSIWEGLHKRDARIVSYAARVTVLEKFKTGDVPVLLMTVQTGAVGLSLTAANYVHIVEPQWNPSVGEQAIARAVRMGQTRAVTIIRYVVKNSVEDNIVQIQRRKRSLAKFTLDGAAQDGSSGTLDDLRFVLDVDLIR